MKISIVNFLRKSGWVALCLAIVTACQDDNEPQAPSNAETQLQTQLTAEETNELIALGQDAMEITSDILENEGVTDGRATTSVNSKEGHFDDHGCNPAIATIYDVDTSREDTIIYTGKITITYGEGTTCDPDHVRKGQIINKFKYTHIKGQRHAWSSVETFTFKRFVKDSTYTNGGLQVTSREGIKDMKFTLTLIDFRDNIERKASARLIFRYQSNESHKWKDNTITVAGRTSGVNRQGHVYEFFIQKPLLFKYACDKHHRFYPVQGTVRGTIDGVEIFISYGDGECDKKYTITINDDTTEHEFGEDRKDS